MDTWESWVGRTTTRSAHLDPDQANRMAVTLDREPCFESGDLLPPAWHWLYFHDLVGASQLGADGHPALGVTMPPVPLERRMWAAGSLTFERPPRLGDTATRTSVIADIVPKQGSTGPLYFVVVRHEISVDGRPRVQEEQTIVYRELAVGPSSGMPVAAPTDGTLTRRWSLDSTALFRYSALTFNSHRIHYDADYARDDEGYPGLVIHGPLLATLLMDLARDDGGELASFTYRARSPLFLPEEFTTNARRDGRGAVLWAASAEGHLAMDATATYKELT
jgi:3-methylfumaryl-CoA hydratase